MSSLAEETIRENLRGAIHVDHESVERHLGELVRSSVEATINGLLEATSPKPCGAGQGSRASASTVRELNQKIYEQIVSNSSAITFLSPPYVDL